MTEESSDYTLAIESAGPSARGGFEFRMRPGIDLAKHLTQSVRSVLDGHGAENYVEMRFDDGEGNEYIATFRRRSGKTPDEMRQQAEAERDRLRVELAEEQRQRTAIDNQVSALVREVQRVTAELGAVERDRDTFREVARGNRRHVAVLTHLVERVDHLTLDGEGKPKDPALILYVGDLRRAIEAPVQVRGDTEAKPAVRHCGTCACIHEPCGYVAGSPGCLSECGQP